MRRKLIAIVTFVAGIYFFGEFFLPKAIIVGDSAIEFGKYTKEIFDVVRVIFVMSFGLGVINILRVYGYQIIRQRPGWLNSAALIVSLLITATAGMWSEFGDNESVKSFFNDLLFEGLMNNLSSAMFSLLAFYMASAAYRSFRVHNFEAALMMLAALAIMIGQIPLGYWLSAEAPQVRNWIMTWISTPAFRGIAFGAMVAGLAMAVRMWLSLERTGGGES